MRVSPTIRTSPSQCQPSAWRGATVSCVRRRTSLPSPTASTQSGEPWAWSGSPTKYKLHWPLAVRLRSHLTTDPQVAADAPSNLHHAHQSSVRGARVLRGRVRDPRRRAAAPGTARAPPHAGAVLSRRCDGPGGLEGGPGTPLPLLRVFGVRWRSFLMREFAPGAQEGPSVCYVRVRAAPTSSAYKADYGAAPAPPCS